MQIHEFDPQIYPVKLWITTGSNNTVLAENFEWYYDDPKIEIDLDSHYAITGLVRQKSTSLVGVLVAFENKKAMTIKNIAHEVSHAVDDVWNRIGEKKVGNEANAYLAGWIAECIEKVKRNKP